MPVARSEPGWCSISIKRIDSTGDVVSNLSLLSKSKCNKFFEFLSYVEKRRKEMFRACDHSHNLYTFIKINNYIYVADTFSAKRIRT